MCLYVEVIFYSGQRKELPASGYRPDAVFQGNQDYWGITFLDLPVEGFDVVTPAMIKFTFQDSHYQEVVPGQFFTILEGARQVGEGKIISIEEK